ncbi:MAG: hypothetical protein CMJ83_07680 [Planctomycetes bacterium]|nr:hypothetical protein [Planctomycetota bacterium]
MNDLDGTVPGACTVEVWRNRVFGTDGVLHRTLGLLSQLAKGPFWHLYLVVREPGGEVARYEIYQPRAYPPRNGDWRLPVSLGGFLQRRVPWPKRDDDWPDPVWGTHLVWSRTWAQDDSEAPRITEEAVAAYRWRDHYPRWFDSFRGRYVNSNTFVEKVVRHFSLTNADGSSIDLTHGGRYAHPGLERSDGWEFAYAGETADLHAEWHAIHGEKPPRGRDDLRGRFVRASGS